MAVTSHEIVAFWTEAGPQKWFAKSETFDAEIRTRFEAMHHTAARGEFAAWEANAEGALALLILLDQFPRNLYRGSAHQFATDGLARSIAERALAAGHDQTYPADLRAFFYLPFEHSENTEDQARSVALFKALGIEEYDKYAALHADIIRRFGRFPHRNACLGRATTPEEQKFLDEGGFAG
ncbi:MAG: DUF924 family protein [Caulobacterales bacterium]